jgi:cellulose synthase/poly-beta-1,6-N-acetylglucosamine synthase-like glycosyltransferase
MTPNDPTPLWVAIFLAVYFTVSFALFFYGMHAYVMAFLFRRAQRTVIPEPVPGELPVVTVQLPVYNERYVARRLIDAVVALEYPRELLEIQVLDDSTDDTRDHIASIVAGWREKGVDISHIHRSRRTGYKAGALAEGLTVARGDLVAIFDADFVPSPGFLRDTTPHFSEPGVGMVQTRWGHLNEDYSVLTRVQAVALDGHFIIEQMVRNRSGAFMNFNGTAGIWRKSCIVDAGNWQHDTLTEDLDLSYRAQLAGWKFVFLPHVVSPAELPAEVNGLKGQQFRWAKGSVQTARKILPGLLRGNHSLFHKFEAVIHLTNHGVYPLLLLLGLLSLPALIIFQRYPQVEPIFAAATVLVVASFGHPWMYLLSQRQAGRGWMESIALVPAVLAGGMGIAINNTRAFVEGVIGHQSGFIRTPKYALLTRSDSWRGKSYRVPLSPWAFAELGLALYAGITLVYALLHGNWLALPFLFLYFAGGVHIGWLSLAHAWSNSRSTPSPVTGGQPVPALD